jgi:hypothetical protein
MFCALLHKHIESRKRSEIVFFINVVLNKYYRINSEGSIVDGL